MTDAPPHRCGSVPDEDALRLEPSSDFGLSGSSRSLKMEVDMYPYDQEQEKNYGAFYVDLGETRRVDAINVSVLIPDGQGDAETDNFWVSFVAVDETGGRRYSGGSKVPAGKWTSYFWGTRYAYSGDNLCEDMDKDNQCDTPAGKL